MSGNEPSNYEYFRESLSSRVVECLTEPAKRTSKSKAKSRKQVVHEGGDKPDDTINPEDFSDFVEFLAAEIFSSLAQDLQELNYAATRNNGELATKYELPLAHSTCEEVADAVPAVARDSLEVYGLASSLELANFIGPVLASYITSCTQPPSSAMTATRAPSCEICERDWIPLSYHHLIPKDVHAKVIRRGWHSEWELSNVAWLCRACHSMVHRIATTEELARHYYTVELLLARDDVQRWKEWAGRLRWKSK